MRRFTLFSCIACLAVGLSVTAWVAAEEARPVPAETMVQWMEELSNWGRWGLQDELGTLNLITEETRRAAATLVKTGVVVSLARDTIQEQAPGVNSPYEHTMRVSGNTQGQFSVDSIAVTFHGYGHTHMDALCHMFHDGKMYNGFSQQSVTAEGCDKLAIQVAKKGIFARGVLMDIPRLKGVTSLEPGTPIYRDDLEEWERKAGLRVGSGDVVLIRTGRWPQWEKQPWNVAEKSAGLHASAVAWLKDRGASMLGSDVASDVFPSGVEGATHPVHQLVLVAMGMPIFDNCDLEAVAAEAERQNRWEFLLTTAPIPITGATGSPLNPIAVF